MLAERIRYSAATLYLYFRNKDDLLFTVVDDAFTRFERELAQAAVSGDPWERLSSLGEAYVRFGLSHPVYYQLMFMWRIDYLIESRQGEDTPRIQAFRVLVDAVRYALDRGAIQPGEPEVYSGLLWAMMHGIVALAIQMPMFDEERTAKLLTHAKEMMYKAFHH